MGRNINEMTTTFCESLDKAEPAMLSEALNHFVDIETSATEIELMLSYMRGSVFCGNKDIIDADNELIAYFKEAADAMHMIREKIEARLREA